MNSDEREQRRLDRKRRQDMEEAEMAGLRAVADDPTVPWPLKLNAIARGAELVSLAAARLREAIEDTQT